MSKIKINKNDKFRILLTELLPYEVPLLFSNEGFYKILKKNSFEKYKLKLNDCKLASEYTIPFDYQIKKAGGGNRKLSIIHPLSQLKFIGFYEKYFSLILNLCSRSSFSIRYPARVAKFCYSPNLVLSSEDTLKDEDVEVEPEVLNEETKLLKSFFTYKKYDLVYKFFESNEFFRLEQRFKYMLSFDISKCFYNIYTHSICWAIKNKEISKRSARLISFENTFDTIMQKSNYNETNGIVVGPEVSRIFAEIILQQVDLDAQKALDENKVHCGIDYEIRRYVDDYYVFSNNQKLSQKILSIFKEKLEAYKLYINTNKTIEKESPFVHEIAVCRFDIKQILSEFENQFIQVIEEDNNSYRKELINIYRPLSISKNLIKKIQYTTKKNQLTYDVIGTETIRHLKKILVKVLKEENIDKNSKNFKNFAIIILDIAFFAYSVDTRVNTTYKISQIIVLLCKACSDINEENKHQIYSKIIQDADFIMTNHKRKSDNENVNIEILNLLISLKCLEGDSYLLPQDKIRSLLGVIHKKDTEKLNYFEIICILYYIGNNNQFLSLKNEIKKAILLRYESEIDCFAKSDLTCMFFDLMTCPYIDIKTKRKILKKSKYIPQTTPNTEAISIVEDLASQGCWFMNWGNDIDLERVLKRKEWGSSY